MLEREDKKMELNAKEMEVVETLLRGWAGDFIVENGRIPTDKEIDQKIDEAILAVRLAEAIGNLLEGMGLL
jgi:hypothetical protein